MSPQQIRDRIMKPDSEFQNGILEYLDNCHIGQFQTGTLEEVREFVSSKEEKSNYIDPTNILPVSPPNKCDNNCNKCKLCILNKDWWDNFPKEVDEIMLKSNIHKCGPKCLNNKYNTCRARFPREIIEKTEVDLNDGSIKIKKHEQWTNFITPTLTYLLRSNSDVTSLLSGTAIKAIIAYVTDYITKVPLKTHTMFDAVRSVFDRKVELINSDQSREEKARKLITNIVNSLTASMEIGGPMASLYLLGNPDHYTNYKFRPFYWRPYVNYIWRAHNLITEKTNNNKEEVIDEDNILILKMKSEYIGYSPILDYIYRPDNYNEICLYDWICKFNKTKIYKRKPKIENNNENENDELDTYDIDYSNEIIKEEIKEQDYSKTISIESNNTLSDNKLDLINDI